MTVSVVRGPVSRRVGERRWEAVDGSFDPVTIELAWRARATTESIQAHVDGAQALGATVHPVEGRPDRAGAESPPR